MSTQAAGFNFRFCARKTECIAVPIFALAMLCIFPAISVAQEGAATRPAAGADPGITLDLPENLELKALLDYVSQRLGMNIVYQEEQVAGQKVTLKSPGKIPADALPGLLESLLKSKGLALTDGDRPNWKRVVPLAAAAMPTTLPAANPNQVVSQIFPLQNIDPARVDQLIKPFLSGPTASSFGVAEQRMVLVTDYASSVERIAQLIRLIDQPNHGTRIEFLPVHFADAGQLASEVKQILLSRVKAQALPGQNVDAVDVTPDRRTGQLVFVGPASMAEEAAKIVKALDVPVNERQSPVRFYKLANATAADVLDTLRSLEGDSDDQRAATPKAGDNGASRRDGAGPSSLSAAGPGVGEARGATGGASYARMPAMNQGAGPTPGEDRPPQSGIGGALNPNGGTAGVTHSANPALKDVANVGGPAALHTAQATVSADTNTNTIIVIAEPAVQQLYEQLIRNLDKRRPQVLIEATIVTLDTSNNFQFGVDLSLRTKNGARKAIVFSSFGLSTPDPTTGQLAIIPGAGFNGTVIASDVATMIIRALAGDSHAKITSAPRVLVNDNATGTLTSLVEAPYTSTNIGTPVATTSFAGYAEAGTEITLTPHISEADYLQLEYAVALSSFQDGGDPAHGIPPARQRDAVQSKVTIPDGSTVIVGGLNRTNATAAEQRIPVLGKIPILGYLFSNHTTDNENLTLFVFLRPIILRDDQFEDLKFLSGRDAGVAGVSDSYPASNPVVIH
jgi:general secretion pathway protein D